ncbi:MAG: DUF3099 domain-containing protein [Candidatus Nanopelagicales bacterium]
MRREDQVFRITSAQPGPSRDLVSRERTYLVMMGIRMVAIVVAVVVPGVWRWVAVAAGIVLPYVAVVLVNAARTRGTEADPNYFRPEPRAALEDRPFEGRVISHDDDAVRPPSDAA